MSRMNRLRRRKLSTFTIHRDDDQPRNALNNKAESVVYHRHALDLGICPRLTRHTSDLRLLDWKKFGWDDTESALKSRLKVLNAFAKSNRRGSESRFSRRKRMFCDLYTLEEEGGPLTTRSLPPLPTNGSGEPMLRRPTIISPRPIPEGGEVFKMITKGRELKPFSFEDDPVKATEFYNKHFPLLCKKLGNRSIPSSARAVTQQDVDPARPSSAEKRTFDLLDRISEAERLLAEIESEPDDTGKMVTELRDLTFDPTSWSWNKERYAIPQGYASLSSRKPG